MHPSPDQRTQFRARWQTLTAREQHILLARCEGQTIGAIADAHSISPMTVKTHRTRAVRKLRGVVASATPDHRGVLEVVCWHLGYEAARQDQEPSGG